MLYLERGAGGRTNRTRATHTAATKNVRRVANDCIFSNVPLSRRSQERKSSIGRASSATFLFLPKLVLENL